MPWNRFLPEKLIKKFTVSMEFEVSCVHKRLPLVPILSQINPHPLLILFFKFHININLPFML
jgi:hypothetical protein